MFWNYHQMHYGGNYVHYWHRVYVRKKLKLVLENVKSTWRSFTSLMCIEVVVCNEINKQTHKPGAVAYCGSCLLRENKIFCGCFCEEYYQKVNFISWKHSSTFFWNNFLSLVFTCSIFCPDQYEHTNLSHCCNLFSNLNAEGSSIENSWCQMKRSAHSRRKMSVSALVKLVHFVCPLSPQLVK